MISNYLVLLSFAAVSAESLVKEIYCNIDGVFGWHEATPDQVHNLDLVVANGGGGQAGMVGFLAMNFLKSFNKNACIGWHASNTHGSHEAVKKGDADVAIVYDIDRLKMAVDNEEVQPNVVHAWMDHFNWIGPKVNSANVQATDTLEEAALKIMSTPSAFWLTRVDQSTIHLKESYVFYKTVNDLRTKFGLRSLNQQDLMNLLLLEGLESMPADTISSDLKSMVDVTRARKILSRDKMAAGYDNFRAICRSGFYRPMKLLPMEATKAANQHSYYTMSDDGIFLSVTPEERSQVNVLMDGKMNGQETFFLNPAYAVRRYEAKSTISEAFMTFLDADRTKKVIVPTFTGRIRENRTPLYASPRESYSKLETETLDEFFSRIPTIFQIQ